MYSLHTMFYLILSFGNVIKVFNVIKNKMMNLRKMQISQQSTFYYISNKDIKRFEII